MPSELYLSPVCFIVGLHKNVPSHTEVTPAINPESAATKTNELEQPLNLDTDSVFE